MAGCHLPDYPWNTSTGVDKRLTLVYINPWAEAGVAQW